MFILDRLVRQGRAFGMHVMLGSQTLAGAYTLARTTIGQMAVRIALQCEESDSRLILSDDNPAARLLSRPGEAIYNAANGLVEGTTRFNVAGFRMMSLIHISIIFKNSRGKIGMYHHGNRSFSTAAKTLIQQKIPYSEIC
jgi:hypothetical protein